MSVPTTLRRLADAYECKEAFYLIWDAKTKEEAAMAIDAGLKAVPKRHEEAFVHAIRAVTEWRTEILAYWDHRVTNAFTENRNHAAKEMNRAGRGYSYDVIRARLLFGKGMPERPLIKCESCNGLFDTDDIVARKNVCTDCYIRIYTERAKYSFPRYTLKSE
jgi:transposase